MTTPSVANFTTFIRNVVGIAAAYLPDGSSAIQHAFDHATDTVNLDLCAAGGQTTSWSVLELAVYNLGAHLLVEFAQDLSWSILAAAWSRATQLVTIQTSVPNTITVGDKVLISGVSPLAYAGPTSGGVVVNSVIDDTHFNYALAKDPGTAIIGPTAAISEQVFATARKGFKMTSFTPGTIASTSDVSTSAGFLNPAFLQGLTLEDLQLLKTPWGRKYLSIAQKYGPTIWGLS